MFGRLLRKLWPALIVALGTKLLVSYVITYPILRLVLPRLRGFRFARIVLNKIILSYILQPTTKAWRTHVKRSVEIQEGLTLLNLSLTPSSPLRSKNFYSGWLTSMKASARFRETMIILFSTPLHYFSYGRLEFGSLMCIYLHSGVRATKIAQRFTRSQSKWDRKQRSQWVYDNWHRFRILGFLLEILELIPFIGDTLIPLLSDIIVELNHANLKLRLELENIDTKAIIQKSITPTSTISSS